MVVAGAVNVASFGGRLLLTSSSYEQTLSSLLSLTIGLFLVAQGAAGLLEAGQGGLSRWFLVLQTLLLFPLIPLAGAQFYAWVGIPGVVAWAVLVVLIFASGRQGRARR